LVIIVVVSEVRLWRGSSVGFSASGFSVFWDAWLVVSVLGRVRMVSVVSWFVAVAVFGSGVPVVVRFHPGVVVVVRVCSG
jgi:hypothetical protein